MKVRQLLPLLLACIFLLPFAVRGEREKTLVEPPWNHCLGIDRVGQFLLGVYSGFGERFVDPAGLDCVKFRSDDDPATGSDDDELTVFGCDRGSGRLFFNRGMRSIGIVTSFGGLSFSGPADVAVTTAGDVFVADTGNDRVPRFRYEGGELLPAGVVETAGGLRLAGPEGVDCTEGVLWIADTGNDRIVSVGDGGDDVASIGPRLDDGRLVGPTGLAVVRAGDPWLYYADFFIAVIDSLGLRLRLLSETGAVRAIVRRSEIQGGGRFGQAAIDYYGNIWVTDPPAGLVHKFDRFLRHIVAIGSAGPDFDEPRGIAINRRFGQVFVSERGGARYRWIGADLVDVSAREPLVDRERKRVAVEISFLLTEHAAVSCRIEDDEGRVVAVLLDDHLLPAGRFTRRVEADCNPDVLHADCTMRVIVSARPTYSSASFSVVERVARHDDRGITNLPKRAMTTTCLSRGNP